MENNKILKAAIYVRVSTEEQANEGYSIEAQKEKLIAFCKSQDWQVYNIYADEGFSAKDLNRPAIQRLIQDAKNKCFDIVVFYKLDRLSRSLKDLTFLIDTFEKVNIKIKSLTEPFDTTAPVGKLMLNMLGSFAQFEREIIGERTRLGLEKAFKQGKWVTVPPFGYRTDNEGKLVVDKNDSIIVKKIFNLFLKKNLGIKAIAHLLNKEDKISSRKGKWNKNSVWKILRNPVYCGYAKWREKIVKRGHKAIISKEMYDEVQKRLAKRNNTPPRTSTSSNLLLGLVWCHNCNSKLLPAKGKHYRYYACPGRQNGCKLPYIPAEDLENSVLDEIVKISEQKNLISSALKALKKKNDSQIQELKKEYSLLKRKLEKLTSEQDKKIKWLSDTLPDKKTTQKIGNYIQKLDEQIKDIKNRLSQLDVELKSKEINHIKAEAISLFLKNFKFYFEEWDARRKRLLLESILEKIIVYDREKIQIKLSIPLPLINKPFESILKNSSQGVASVGGVTVFASRGVGEGTRTPNHLSHSQVLSPN